jgi:integrase
MAQALIAGDSTLRAIKPGDPRKRINDGGGLFLLLFVKGGAHGWRFSYSLGGKRLLISLGTYPDTGLALAREKAEKARKLVAAGIDPSGARKADKGIAAARREAEKLEAAGLPSVGSFEQAAREWHARMSPSWSPTHAVKVLAILTNDLFPYIGARPLAALTAPELLKQARRVEERGARETAYRAIKAAGAVFRHGVQNGYCESDPTRDLKGAITLPLPAHRAAVTDPAKLGDLLRAIADYRGTPAVRAALKLAPMVFLRPGELRQAEWPEFDLDGATWTVPAARMKGRLASKLNGPPHVVPLCQQAVAILRDLQPLTGRGRYVFSSLISGQRPMSENTINTALRRMGFEKDEVTGHGFRATARTILAERLGVAPEVIEAQLAHKVPDALGRAYNRTLFLEQRIEMMQRWADYLDRVRQGASVVALVAA